MQDQAYDDGRAAAENDGDWRDNPHLPGTTDWFAFNDGLEEGGRE